jgi:hypothetical protein
VNDEERDQNRVRKTGALFYLSEMSVERSLIFWNSRGPELTCVLSSLPLRKTLFSSSTFPFNRINASAFHPKLSKRCPDVIFEFERRIKNPPSKTARSILQVTTGQRRNSYITTPTSIPKLWRR